MDPEETTSGRHRQFMDIGEPERRVSAEDLREMKYDIKRLEKLPERLAGLQASMDSLARNHSDLQSALGETNKAVAGLQRDLAREQALASWVNKLVFLAVVALAGAGWYTAVDISRLHSEIMITSNGAPHH
jgi:hypothetical protein